MEERKRVKEIERGQNKTRWRLKEDRESKRKKDNKETEGQTDSAKAFLPPLAKKLAVTTQQT